jgi:hypothetical protein
MSAVTSLAPRPSTMSRAKPIARSIVFIVDDDISVRESREPLIADAGWRPAVFDSAEEILTRARELAPSAASFAEFMNMAARLGHTVAGMGDSDGGY